MTLEFLGMVFALILFIVLVALKALTALSGSILLVISGRFGVSRAKQADGTGHAEISFLGQKLKITGGVQTLIILAGLAIAFGGLVIEAKTPSAPTRQPVASAGQN